MKHRHGFVKPYFSLDAASILPVHLLISLLDLSRDKETSSVTSILDMCAAPGGKTLLLLNYLLNYASLPERHCSSNTDDHSSFPNPENNNYYLIRLQVNEAKPNRFQRMVLMLQSHLPHAQPGCDYVRRSKDRCNGMLAQTCLEKDEEEAEGEEAEVKRRILRDILEGCVTFRPTPNLELIATRGLGENVGEHNVRNLSQDPPLIIPDSPIKSSSSSLESIESQYDAILVDVPCSADRSWLFNHPVDNPSLPQRLAALDSLPALHGRLLDRALRLVRPGGVVVYCTCTLDAHQNGQVVRQSLAADESRFQVLDLRFVIEATSHLFRFCDPIRDCREDWAVTFKEGISIVPAEGKNWGPMFISAIRKL